MVEGEEEILAAESADFRIAPHHHIQGCAQAGHTAPQFGPGDRHGFRFQASKASVMEAPPESSG
jgi:hypothetical protein